MAEEQKARTLPDFVIIGRILKPHGVHGALRIEPETDDPQRFHELKRVLVGDDNHPHESFDIHNVQLTPRFVILTLKDVHYRSDAEALKGLFLWIPREETMPLPEESHYYFELIGMGVETNSGEKIGTVKDVIDYPAHHIFVVERKDNEIMIPDVPDFIEAIDDENGKIIVNPIEGLLD